MVYLSYVDRLVFEYDFDKSRSNLEKHGIDFKEIQELWKNDVLIFESKNKSEKRLLVVGAIGVKFWTVIVTIRGDRKNIIRIISARRSRHEEKELYEKN